MNFLRRWAPSPLTLLSAVLVVLAFPPWDLYPLIFFALVPWLFALEKAQKEAPTRTLAQSLWLGAGMTIGGFYWVSYVLHEFGGLPWPVAILGLLLFTLVCQPQFVLAAISSRWAITRWGTRARGPLFFAIVYSLWDTWVPKLFVDTFGHSLYRANWLRQAADIGGAFAMTFLIVWINTVLYELARRRKPSLAGTLVLIGLVAGWVGYGKSRDAEIRALLETPRARVRAAAIQANIGDLDKIAAETGVSGATDRVVSTYIDMTERALSRTPRPDFIVWPETAYPSLFRSASTNNELRREERIVSLIRSAGVPLLFGGYDHDQGRDFNSLFALDPAGDAGLDGRGDMQIYHKNILLLGGEYVPGYDWLPFFKSTFPQVANFGRGPGPQVLTIRTPNREVPTLRVAPIICYEALFIDYLVASARMGSQLILNITNDSWFGPRGEPVLHQALTTFRSIETRVPQLRATNTGISSLILPSGEITQATPIGVQTTLFTDIPIIDSPQTTIVRVGNWWPWAILLLLVGAVASCLIRRHPGARK